MMYGGHSPAAWLDVTSRASWDVSCLDRGAQWIEFVDQGAKLRCNEWSFFGNLEWATQEDSNQAPQITKVARRKSGMADAPPFPAKVIVRSDSRVVKGAEPDSPTLPRQTDRKLLSRYAGAMPRLHPKRAATSVPMPPSIGRPPISVASKAEACSFLGTTLTKRVKQVLAMSTSSIQDAGSWCTLLSGPTVNLNVLNELRLSPRSSEAGLGSPVKQFPRLENPAQPATRFGTNCEESLTENVALPGDQSEPPQVAERFHWRPSFILQQQQPHLVEPNPTTPERWDWNLEALSSGMKRVLDEEARRHGINV
jgi:hypothetical protein